MPLTITQAVKKLLIQDPFYGLFLLSLDKRFDSSIPTACVGRNGMHRYNNMDHSMKTAIVCVNNIINNCDIKDNIWNVNTEQEYHEVKNEETN